MFVVTQEKPVFSLKSHLNPRVTVTGKILQAEAEILKTQLHNLIAQMLFVFK